MSFSIAGDDANRLIPGAVINMIFGAGTISDASQPFLVLLVGMKTSAGSMVVDNDITLCSDINTADALAGAGSQLARMAYKALLQPGVQLYLAAVAEPTGVQATATFTFSTAVATASGQWGIRIGGELVTGGINIGDTDDVMGARMVTTINNWDGGRLPVTAAYASHILTFTCKNKGVQGNDWILAWDPTLYTSGNTAPTLAGSAAQGTNRVRMGATAGTGTEDVTNILTKIAATRYARIGAAQYDTGTNAPKWLSFITTQSNALTLKIAQVCFAENAAYATAQTLAQTDLNAVLGCVTWLRNAENHPAEIAAGIAAIRGVNEASEPLTNYDSMPLPGIYAQFLPADVHTDTENNVALQNGVTPLASVGTSAVIVRGVTSHSLYNSLADRRTIDWGDANVPERGVYDLKTLWSTSFLEANPIVGDNVPPEEGDPPAGVGTPILWDQSVYRLFSNDAGWKRWIVPPQSGDISSYFDSPSEEIAQTVYITPRRVQHKIRMQVLQATNA